jgi:diguanylate cyclase (GGDEF)-like protein
MTLPSRPKISLASRSFSSRFSFRVRLFATLVLALVVATVAQLALTTPRLERSFIERAAESHRGDAAGLSNAYQDGHKGEKPLEEAQEFLMALGAQSGVDEVFLIDDQARIVGSSEPQRRGQPYREQAVLEGLRGESSAEMAEHHGARQLSMVDPVSLGGKHYVLHTERAANAFDADVAEARLSALLFGVNSLIVAVLAFYLLGGRKLSRAHGKALDKARLDTLTQLGNHGSFQEALIRTADAAERRGRSFGVLMLDVDDFKKENDRLGHLHGDRILRAVADVLHSGRASDEAFRLGGDEFAVLLPVTGQAGARVAAARLSTQLSERVATPVSIGYAVSELERSSPAEVWHRADVALYRAKRQGRDPVGAEPRPGGPAAVSA